ncbi:epoxide hydrolase, partial [Moniliophthora roreri]
MDLRCHSSRRSQTIFHVEGKTIRSTAFVDTCRGALYVHFCVGRWRLTETSRQELQFQSNELRKGRLAALLCWYKVMISGIGLEDDKSVPAQNTSTSIPAFFGPALEDYVALAALAIPATQKLCSDSTSGESLRAI